MVSTRGLEESIPPFRVNVTHSQRENIDYQDTSKLFGSCVVSGSRVVFPCSPPGGGWRVGEAGTHPSEGGQVFTGEGRYPVGVGMVYKPVPFCLTSCSVGLWTVTFSFPAI